MQLNSSSYLSERAPCSSFHFDGSSFQRWWSIRVVQILEPGKRQTFDNGFWILIPMIRQIEKDTIRKKINQEKHMEMLTDSGFEVAHNWTLEQTLFLSQPKKTEIGVGVQTRSIDKIVFVNQMPDCFFVWAGFEQLWSIMVDSRKLQRNMSNALETGYSFERNTGFFFRIISSEEKLQLGKNKNKRKKRKCSIRKKPKNFRQR